MIKLNAYSGQQAIKDEELRYSGTLAFALSEQEFWWMLPSYEVRLQIPMCLPLVLRPQLRPKLKTWVEEFLNAVPVGADLSLVWPEYAQWLLTDRTYGVLSGKYDRIRIDRVEALANLHRQWLNGLQPEFEEWQETGKIITELKIYNQTAASWAADAYCYGAFTFGAYWAWKGSKYDCERYAFDQRSHWVWDRGNDRGDKHGDVVKETFLSILRAARSPT